MSDIFCNGQVSHCLGEILDLCQSFCGLISHSEAILSAQESARLEDIATVCTHCLLLSCSPL